MWEPGLGRGHEAWRPQLLVGLAAVLVANCGSQTITTPSPMAAPSPTTTPSPATTAPEGDGVFGQWVSSGGRQRTYAVHVPPSCDGTRPCPLILAFHGAGGNHDFAERVGLFRAADRVGFVVAAPDGVAGDWALRCGGCTGADKLGIDDVGFVSTLVTHLAGHLAIDRSRIYATGRSDGGSFTHRLACDYPLAGAAVVAGLLFQPELCQPARSISLLAFHGTADTVIPVLQGTGSTQYWANLDGCSPTPTATPLPDRANDGTTVTRYDFSGCSEGTEVTFFAIEGGGHNWPGSPTPESAGLQTHDIEASEEMVDFFARHALGTTPRN